MLAGMRERLIARRTQLSNAIRGYAAEFGLISAKGLDKIEPLLAASRRTRPCRPWHANCSRSRTRDYRAAAGGTEEGRCQADGLAPRQCRQPAPGADSGDRADRRHGAGHEGARSSLFPSGRHFAAWIGLTPKDHSTAGKTRLGTITRAGDEVLRSVLVAGATAVIQQVRRGRGHPSPWLVALLKRKPPKLAAVALANKIARIAWKLMATGESYDGGGCQAHRRTPLKGSVGRS